MSIARRWKIYVTLLHLTVFASHLPWLWQQVVRKTELLGSDFTIFYAGWSLILRGRPSELYDLEAQRAVERALIGDGLEFPGGVVPFLHPPHAALAMSPLALLPRGAATWLWTAIQVALLAWLVRTLARTVGARTSLDRWLLAAAVLAYPPVFTSLQMGQLAIGLTVALLGLALAAEKRRDGASALWLLALAVKPHLLLAPLALLAAQRRWGVLARFTAAAAAVGALTSAGLGRGIYRDFFLSVPQLEQVWGKGGPQFMVNLRGSLVRLLDRDTPGPVFAAAVVAALAGYALARRQRARGEPDEAAWPPVLGLGLLFNPHVFLHDALLWGVPLALCYRRLDGARARHFAVFALSWPLVNLVNEAFEHRDHLLPLHLLFVQAAVGSGWMLWLAMSGPETSRQSEGPTESLPGDGRSAAAGRP